MPLQSKQIEYLTGVSFKHAGHTVHPDRSTALCMITYLRSFTWLDFSSSPPRRIVLFSKAATISMISAASASTWSTFSAQILASRRTWSRPTYRQGRWIERMSCSGPEGTINLCHFMSLSWTQAPLIFPNDIIWSVTGFRPWFSLRIPPSEFELRGRRLPFRHHYFFPLPTWPILGSKAFKNVTILPDPPPGTIPPSKIP